MAKVPVLKNYINGNWKSSSYIDYSGTLQKAQIEE